MDILTPITREEMLMNDEPLTPITREEKILAGEDLTPVTRREYFLKKYRHAGGDVMVEGLEVTANGTYTAPEGKAYSPVEVNVPLPENAYLLKTASGSLVSFSDGADLPMPSFVCNIDAVQDLHGYDSPWVGGAGKNKYPITIGRDSFLNNVSATHTTDNDVLTISCVSANDSGVYATPSSSLYEASTKLTGTYTWSVDIKCDKNATIAVGYQQVGRLYVSATTQWQRVSYTAEYSGSAATFTIYNKSGEEVSIQIKNLMIQEGETATSYEPYSNICPISGHTGVEAVISPTTEASDGTTYSVSWQTEAGEVYGGYVDLVSGILTITHKYKLFDGTEAWTITTSSSGSNYITIDDMKVGTRMDGICNFFDTVIEGTSAENAGKCQFGNNNQRFYILNAKGVYDADTQAKMRALTTGMQIVYPLAEAQTYQLTPTQIKSLLGNNNAWCDTGDVDIEYFGKGAE